MPAKFLFSDGFIKAGCNDLTSAVKWAEGMMQPEAFRNWAARLLSAEPGALDLIENSTIRAFIDCQMHLCVEELVQFRQPIQLIAEKLCERDELIGDEIEAFLDSDMHLNLSTD